ncbi:MAG: hypothetical protein LBI43_07165 [Streptococcaceae bacterium]|jgi:hypothetical protein|nr:hypothetical protein [Streptococcaceae bacterium]
MIYNEIPTSEDRNYFKIVMALAREGYPKEEAEKIADTVLKLRLEVVTSNKENATV